MADVDDARSSCGSHRSRKRCTNEVYMHAAALTTIMSMKDGWTGVARDLLDALAVPVRAMVTNCWSKLSDMRSMGLDNKVNKANVVVMNRFHVGTEDEIRVSRGGGGDSNEPRLDPVPFVNSMSLRESQQQTLWYLSSHVTLELQVVSSMSLAISTYILSFKLVNQVPMDAY